MTSGNFNYLPVSSIVVDRENRQRRVLEKVEELAQSIADNGLMNPIVITRDNVLVAGERRLEAHKHLGFESIAVHYTDELDPERLHILELEENVRRVDLSWQDQVQAVAKYHRAQEAANPDGWSVVKTSEQLGMSDKNTARYLLVNSMMEEGVKEVVEAPRLSTAVNFAERRQERKKAAFVRDVLGADPLSEPETTPDAEIPPTALTSAVEIRQADFLQWSRTVLPEPFNLIHCDFPYGINAGDKKGYTAAKSMGGYDDSLDVYIELLETFCMNQDNFCSPSAHMVFWFSMEHYAETVRRLRDAEWNVNPFPLVWHKSDNAGVVPDHQRGPRRTYETALFCTRGGRYIVRPVANSISSPTTKQFHMSEKPHAVLTHFFRMLVDPSTRLLDPTAGSGMAVKVADELGAQYSLGLEKEPDYVIEAQKNLGIIKEG